VAPARTLSASWERNDRFRDLSVVVGAGVVAAFAMAIFGLPSVNLHGPLHYVGIMDPLCGMTRAARFLALGDIASAVRYNPASPALVVLAAAVLARAVAGTTTGWWFDFRMSRSRGLRGAFWLAVAVLWANQQANAALLTRG